MLLHRAHPPWLQFRRPEGVPLYPVARMRLEATRTAPTRRFIQLLRREARLQSLRKYVSQHGRKRSVEGRLREVRWVNRWERVGKSLLMLRCVYRRRLVSPVGAEVGEGVVVGWREMLERFVDDTVASDDGAAARGRGKH